MTKVLIFINPPYALVDPEDDATGEGLTPPEDDGTGEWFTPPEFFAALDVWFGLSATDPDSN